MFFFAVGIALARSRSDYSRRRDVYVGCGTGKRICRPHYTDLFDGSDAEGEIAELGDDELELFRDDITEESTKIIVMERGK